LPPHFHVEQEDVRKTRFCGGKEFLGAREGSDGVASFIAQQILNIVQEVDVVIENGDVNQLRGNCRSFVQ
jgi:hypothetical protein